MRTVPHRRLTISTAALALALLASGCAGAAAPVETGSSVSPTAEAIALTGIAEPNLIFGGDCSLLFTDDEMVDIVGAGTTPRVDHDADADGVEDRIGGLDRELGLTTCYWANEDTSVRLTAYWDALDLAVPEQDCGLYQWGEISMNTDLCVVDAESHGIRLDGHVIAPNKQKSQQIAGELLDRFRAVDLSEAAGEPRPRPAGAWDFRELCEAIGPITLDGEPVQLITDILGTDAGALPLEDAIDRLYPPSGCFYNSETPAPRFNFDFIPGGAWSFDSTIAAHDAFNEQDGVQTSPAYQAATVPGFSNAARQDDNGNRTYLLVSGPNFLRATIRGDTDDATLLNAIRERLDELTAG